MWKRIVAFLPVVWLSKHLSIQLFIHVPFLIMADMLSLVLNLLILFFSCSLLLFDEFQILQLTFEFLDQDNGLIIGIGKKSSWT